MSAAVKKTSPAEMLRAGRRILRQMSGGAVLLGDAGRYVLVQPGGKAGAAVEQALVGYLVSQGLISAGADRVYRMSAAGTACLARGRTATPDRFAAQHRIMIDAEIAEPGAVRRYRINACAAPLVFLHQRGLISASERDAGERLQRDFYLAQMAPRLGVNWDAPVQSGRSAPGAVPEMVLAAKQRVRQALKAVGPELAGVLLDLCCTERGLEETEKSRGWPRASAKIVFRLALAGLARHYGLGQCRQHGKLEFWHINENNNKL